MLMRSCDAASADETDRKPDTGGLGAVADSLLRVTADCLIRTATQTQRGWVGGALMLPLRDNQRRLAPLQPTPPHFSSFSQLSAHLAGLGSPPPCQRLTWIGRFVDVFVKRRRRPPGHQV